MFKILLKLRSLNWSISTLESTILFQPQASKHLQTLYVTFIIYWKKCKKKKERFFFLTFSCKIVHIISEWPDNGVETTLYFWLFPRDNLHFSSRKSSSLPTFLIWLNFFWFLFHTNYCVIFFQRAGGKKCLFLFFFFVSTNP